MSTLTRWLALSVFFLPLLTACETEPEVVEMEDEVIETTPAPMTSDVTAQGTIDAIPAAGITTMAPTAALDNINGWLTALAGADFPNADDVREGLTDLRTALQTQPLDGSNIGNIIEELGDDTIEAGENSGDASVLRLGQALKAAGERID